MYNKKLIGFFLIALILAVCIGTASASENTTLTSANEEKTFTDIQTAIDNASENDTIELEGNYKSQGKEIQINKSITITSKDGAVLDGNGKSTIFNITNVNVCLMNLNIKNSYSNTPTPAIYTTGNLSIINSNFTNNTVFLSYYQAYPFLYSAEPCVGSIYSKNNLNITNSTFIDNYEILENVGESFDDITYKYSSSFYNITYNGYIKSNGKLTIKKSKFKDMDIANTHFIEDSTFKTCTIGSKSETKIINSTFSDGKYDTRYSLYITGNLTLIDSNFTKSGIISVDYETKHDKIIINGCNFNNSPKDIYELMAIDCDEILINNSNFSNTGAIRFSNTKLSVINTTFKNNKNGLYFENGKFLNCTFSNNFEFVQGEKISIKNCTFKNNSGHFGSAINGNEIIITDSEFIGNQEGVIISHENISIDGKIISGENAFDNDLNKISLIRVSVSKFTTTYLSGKNIEIRLTFKDGKPVSRYDLILGITNGKKTKYYYESTNSKGVCNFESSNLNVGTYKLEIIGDYSSYSNIPKKTTTVKITKAKTIIKAPKVTNKYKKSKYFQVTVKNKATKKAVKNTYVKVKIDKKTYKIKTNSKGVAKFNTKKLKIGKHKVVISSGNSNYIMSSKSTITIK